MEIKIITKITPDDMQIREEKLCCLRFLWNLCHFVGDGEIIKTETELAELCNAMFGVNFISRHTIMYTAEVIDGILIEATDDKVDGHSVHKITLSTHMLCDIKEYNRLIEETYSDYSLKGRAESDLWK